MSYLYQEEDANYEKERKEKYSTSIEKAGQEILNRKMFFYSLFHILTSLTFCLWWRVKNRNLIDLKNGLLWKEKIYNLGEERLNKDLDVINFIR